MRLDTYSMRSFVIRIYRYQSFALLDHHQKVHNYQLPVSFPKFSLSVGNLNSYYSVSNILSRLACSKG